MDACIAVYVCALSAACACCVCACMCKVAIIVIAVNKLIKFVVSTVMFLECMYRAIGY